MPLSTISNEKCYQMLLAWGASIALSDQVSYKMTTTKQELQYDQVNDVVTTVTVEKTVYFETVASLTIDVSELESSQMSVNVDWFGVTFDRVGAYIAAHPELFVLYDNETDMSATPVDCLSPVNYISTPMWDFLTFFGYKDIYPFRKKWYRIGYTMKWPNVDAVTAQLSDALAHFKTRYAATDDLDAKDVMTSEFDQQVRQIILRT